MIGSTGHAGDWPARSGTAGYYNDKDTSLCAGRIAEIATEKAAESAKSNIVIGHQMSNVYAGRRESTAGNAFDSRSSLIAFSWVTVLRRTNSIQRIQCFRDKSWKLVGRASFEACEYFDHLNDCMLFRTNGQSFDTRKVMTKPRAISNKGQFWLNLSQQYSSTVPVEIFLIDWRLRESLRKFEHFNHL